MKSYRAAEVRRIRLRIRSNIPGPSGIRAGRGIQELVLARDVAGLIVLTMMLTADGRSVGIALLVEAIIPLGDMSIILGSGGSKSRAFSIHGVTCVVMLGVGFLLIHAI